MRDNEYLFFIEDAALETVCHRIRTKDEPADIYAEVSLDLAGIFRDIDFDLWALFFSGHVGSGRSKMLAGEYRNELEKRIKGLRGAGSKKDIKEIIDLYEGIVRYGPEEDEYLIREEMLPYYLKGFQFKSYAHWKHRIEKKKAFTISSLSLSAVSSI